jgi:hypothetical protein
MSPTAQSIRRTGCALAGAAGLDAALVATDCAVVVTDHSSYDWAAIRQ